MVKATVQGTGDVDAVGGSTVLSTAVGPIPVGASTLLGRCREHPVNPGAVHVDQLQPPRAELERVAGRRQVGQPKEHEPRAVRYSPPGRSPRQTSSDISDAGSAPSSSHVPSSRRVARGSSGSPVLGSCPTIASSTS